MSDFLDHLLAQVRPGAATALEPRAPSRFEPVRMAGDDGPESVAPPEPVVAAPVAAPVAELSPLRRPKQARVEQPAVQEPAVAPRPAPVEVPIAPLEADERPRRRPLPAEPAAAAPVPHGAPAPQPAVQPAAELRPYEVRVPVPGEVAAVEPGEMVHELVIRETLREIAPAEPAPAEASLPEAVEALVPRAEPPPLAAVAPVQPQLPPAIAEPAPVPPAPIVEVRIGRIEIHAPQPTAPAVETAPRPAAAGASRLDRYLARG